MIMILQSDQMRDAHGQIQPKVVVLDAIFPYSLSTC